MYIEIIAIIVFSVCYVLATIFRAKTDAMIHEFERITKRCLTPDFNKYQSLAYISIVLGSIAAGVILGLFI